MQPRRSLTPILAAGALVALLAWPCAAHAAIVRAQDDDARLRFVGATRQAVTRAASGDSRRTLLPGSSVEASFTGTAAAWIGAQAPTLGQARVFLDGAPVAVVDVRGSLAEQRRLWSVTGLANGPHSLRIVADGYATVDAIDASGTIAAASRPRPMVRVEQSDTRLAWSDHVRTVSRSSASGGSLRQLVVGATGVSASFEGTDITWIGERWPGGGRARVWIDGSDQGVVSLWAPSVWGRRVLFSRAGLSDGPHTLRVVALGQKDAIASGTTVAVDAVDAAGVFRQLSTNASADDRRVRLDGAWRLAARSTGSSRAYSSSPGASASLTFRGTGFTVRADKGPSAGTLGVWVDGEYRASVDLYASSPASRARVWSAHGLARGTHTVTVKVRSGRNAASTGNLVGLDGFDTEGEPVSYGAASGHGRMQAEDSRTARVGGWSVRSAVTASGGTVTAASAKGSCYYFEFVGTGFTWFGPRSTAGGRARVWVDGRSVGTVTQYRPGSRVDQRAIFSAGGLSAARHRVMIEVLGEKDAASTGTWVAVDWIDIDGTIVQAHRPAPFSYPWQTYIVIDKSECNLYWVKNGYLVKTYRCAVGKPSTQTPVGVWRVGIKYYTDPGGIYGPRKMRLFRRVGSSFVYTAYNIHGTNQPWVIGTWASHGCIRMYNSQVLELFPQVPVGTMVVTKE